MNILKRILIHFDARIDAVKAERAAIKFRCGYDWCAGVLLRGEMSAADVVDMVERTRAFEVERDPFDDGVEAALERLSA